MDEIKRLKQEEAKKLSFLNRIRFWVATHFAERRLKKPVHDAKTVDALMKVLEWALWIVAIIVVGTYILITILAPLLVFFIAWPFRGFDAASTYALFTFLGFVALGFIAAFFPDEDPELIDVLIDLYRD